MAFLANNSTKVPLGPNASFNGVSVLVPVNIYSLYCSFNVDTSGTLYVYHSYDGSVYDTFGDEFVVLPEDHHREVPVKGKYLKVKYTNGAVSQVAFSLYSKFTDVSASNVLTYPNLDSCIIDGVLQTSGGGGGGGDVNVLNFDDLADIQLKATVNTVDVSTLATQSTQADILLLAELQDLNGVKINPDHPALTSYDFVNNHVAMTMKGPTSEDFRWSIDTTNNREGWLFSNQNGDTDGGNCYWYSNGAGFGNQTPLQYQNFTSFYTVVTINNTDNVNNTPFIGCYSPATGTNDCIPTFAHSRWVFSLAGGTQLFQYEKVLLYYGEIPRVHSNIRHIPLSLVSIGNNGDRDPTEIIYLITTNTASGRPVGSINYLLQNAGFIALDVNREYEFNNSLERKQLANLSATNVPVVVSNFPLQLTSIGVNNFPAVQPVSGTFYQATQPVSGTFFQETQPVSIASSVAVTGSFYPETQPISGSISVSNTGFNVDNFPTSFDVGNFPTSFDVGNFPTTFDVGNFPTSFDVNNFPTTFDVGNFPTSFDVGNFPTSFNVGNFPTTIDSHMYANSSGNNQIQVHCDNQGYLLTGIVDSAENRCTTSAVNGSRGLDVNVLNGTSSTPLFIKNLDGSGTAITSTTNSTKQGLDVNITNLSTNQVQIRALTSSDVVSANVKSGSGTAITSTTVSTKTGLDANIVNSSLAVTGTFYQATQPVSMTYSSSAPLYCTPGVDVGSNLNTGWNNSSLTASSVSTAIDIQWARTISVLARATGAGTLVLQVSVDNTNWYTTATTIALLSTADTVVNYNDLGARYVRLKSNSIVAGVYATICGK